MTWLVTIVAKLKKLSRLCRSSVRGEFSLLRRCFKQLVMSSSQEELKELKEELKWVTLREDIPFREKIMSKGIFGVLVPLGCIVTTGVLISGVHNMIKRDSKKQQLLMRYRVLAQGVTILLAAIGLVEYKFSS